MKPTKRQATVLAEYIVNVGLSLTNKWDEIFQTDFKPAFDARWDQRASTEDWDGFEGEIRKEYMIEAANGRERARIKLVRLLRSFELVAVGRTNDRALTIIQPRRWDRLILKLGRNSVSDAEGRLHHVRIAPIRTLGAPQRAALNEYVYGLSERRVAERHGDLPKKGRPPTKRMLVEKWVQEQKALGKKLPMKLSAAMTRATTHFESLRGREKISDETIRRVLKALYP